LLQMISQLPPRASGRTSSAASTEMRPGSSHLYARRTASGARRTFAAWGLLATLQPQVPRASFAPM
jgi:hypothetical protein